MLGSLYFMICIGIGFVICELFFPRLSLFGSKTYGGNAAEIPSLFVCLPAWSIFGLLPVTWVTYLIAYLFQGKRHPLFYANAIVMPVAAGIIVAYLIWRHKQSAKTVLNAVKDLSLAEILFAAVVFAFYMVLFFWTFSYHDHEYYIGWTVASDFSPHIGMIRSFSIGNNFPTQYSHFAGEDIKYHFLFQFFVGNLNYLGIRLDWAFNFPSIWFMVCTYMLLYFYTVKLTGKKAVGYLSTVLFSFRSSFAFFEFAGTINKASSVMDQLRENPAFIGKTEHEDWGLWNLNVYCNQRHLAVGLCVLLFVLIYFTQFLYGQSRRVKAAAESRMLQFFAEHPDAEPLPGEKAEYMARESFLRKEGWISSKWTECVGCGLLLGLCSFFNGACVIACLCVLFVMAWLSDRRIEFAMTASITVILSLLSTKFFISGSAVELKYQFGFLADQPTIFGVIRYLALLCGILPVAVLAAQFFLSGTGKFLSFAFTAPVILAFTVTMTNDIAVNHKYIMIGVMLLCIPAAVLVHKLWQLRGMYAKAIAILLLFSLTITGIYECGVIFSKNDEKNDGVMKLNEDSDLCKWVMEHSESKDIYLTNWYSLNEVVLGGAMLYFGWPYYAWSAGYDTYGREPSVYAMYTASTSDELDALVKQCGIRYIVIDASLYTREEFVVNEQNIVNTYKLVYNDGATKIFDTHVRLKANGEE